MKWYVLWKKKENIPGLLRNPKSIWCWCRSFCKLSWPSTKGQDELLSFSALSCLHLIPIPKNCVCSKGPQPLGCGPSTSCQISGSKSAWITPMHPWSVQKLSSTNSVPGTKKVGDRCSAELLLKVASGFLCSSLSCLLALLLKELQRAIALSSWSDFSVA